MVFNRLFLGFQSAFWVEIADLGIVLHSVTYTASGFRAVQHNLS